MSWLTKLVAHKLFATCLLFVVGVWFLVIPAFTNSLGANPVEKLLHATGEIAIWTLGVSLSLTPLRVIFPKSRIVNALNRHRRTIGVSACLYGLLHFACHVVYQSDLDDLLASFTKPFIWFGSGGLIILVILAATSNNWMTRKLGGKNWKRLHRLTYLAGLLLIYHQSIAGKGHWYIARWLLLVVVLLQLTRIAKKLLSRNKAPGSPPVSAGVRGPEIPKL
jgi:methionine sulfoxide reductase heme-binding subunit